MKSLRLDCSSGYDSIPVSLIRPVAEILASPLTHIINCGIDQNMFHKAWKINKITPVPKIEHPTVNDDYRPVSVLPILSKVYERLVCKQFVKYIDEKNIYKDTMSGFRANHSTDTLLLKIRDDIIKSMNRGEVTLAVLADYSKAFDTMNFSILIPKLSKIGFSKDSIRWVVSYLTNRYQYIQIDDKFSKKLPVLFGVPQGSVLGPILFNIYVSDLQNNVSSNTSQYADDTSFYEHAPVKGLKECAKKVNDALNDLNGWSRDCGLLLNPKKSKFMLFSSKRMSTVHSLNDGNVCEIIQDDNPLERVSDYKLLGVIFNEHLDWTNHFQNVTKACYTKLAQLRKIKRFTPYHIRKQLAESLILSKLDYCNSLFPNAPQYLLNRLQKIQNSAASFVIGKYSTRIDVIELKWLPIRARIDYSILKLVYKRLHKETLPVYLTLKKNVPRRTLRSSSGEDIYLSIPLETNTFEGVASRLFNGLPKMIRAEANKITYNNLCKAYLLDRELTKVLSS